MKLYSSIGPNPRVVQMFLALKGIEIPIQQIDLPGAENRRAAFLAINPAGQLPVLELDSGQIICETAAICEYLDEMYPEPPMFGQTPAERAQVRMWVRRVDYAYVQPVTAAFRAGPGLAMFQNRLRCIPHAAEDFTASVRDGEAWLNQQLEGQLYLAGSIYSFADLLLFCFVQFAGDRANLGLRQTSKAIALWVDRIKPHLATVFMRQGFVAMGRPF